MKNLNELILVIRDLKVELEECFERSVGLTCERQIEQNLKIRNNLINEILRLESITREEVNRRKDEVLNKKVEDAENLVMEGDTEEVFGQEKLERAFLRKLDEIKIKFNGASLKLITDTQRQTILSGIKDRIGIVVGQDIIKDIVRFNYEQASQVIKVLQKISFYNQRLQVTTAIKNMKSSDNYVQIVKEVRANLNYRAWFDANKDLLVTIAELQPPTEAQIRMIANVARYSETAYTLQDFGLDIMDYETRAVRDGQLMNYYVMNWDKFKKDIEDRLNRESASNFIQTWGYLTNLYAGKDLDKHERAHLRSLYLQLGEMELTRPSHLNTITKDNYEYIVRDLEHLVRVEKMIQNSANSKFREEMYQNSARSYARETKKVKLTKDQEDARDLFNFVHTMYAVVGQEMPEEMRAILPDSYSQSRQSVYTGIEEQHLPTFRRLVMEQRQVVKTTYIQYDSNDSTNQFNWGAFVANQPESVLKALGLFDMM